ncbi:hypothetical protein HA402_003968 [Bradysia odoriphaga]|nr:hypothetical protein HA402_003968 [Bradysia odoriphaga]
MDQSSNRLILTAFLIFMISDLKPLASLRPETVKIRGKKRSRFIAELYFMLQKNRFHLDRFTCTILNPEKIVSVHCMCKHISWSNLKIDSELIFSRPIRNIWLHAVCYYKFNGIVYNKFPIDLWENVCDYADGKRKNTFFLDWWVARVIRFSNFNHPCPYSNISVKTNNVSLDEIFSFDKSIFPSGRYRVDLSITEDDRIPFLKMAIFGSNSEHDLEKI